MHRIDADLMRAFPGPARCLRCGKWFASRDRRRNRICGECNKKEFHLSRRELAELKGGAVVAHDHEPYA